MNQGLSCRRHVRSRLVCNPARLRSNCCRSHGHVIVAVGTEVHSHVIVAVGTEVRSRTSLAVVVVVQRPPPPRHRAFLGESAESRMKVSSRTYCPVCTFRSDSHSVVYTVCVRYSKQQQHNTARRNQRQEQNYKHITRTALRSKRTKVQLGPRVQGTKTFKAPGSKGFEFFGV